MQHKLIKPSNFNKSEADHYPLIMDDEPFFAKIEDSIKKCDCIEYPDAKFYVAVPISKTQFNRHAEYYAGGEYYGVWTTLKYADQNIYLIYEGSDENHELYCIGTPVNVPILFGKMSKSNIVYKTAIEMIYEFFNNINISRPKTKQSHTN